jgi:genome maintenance exonuclease 1
MKEFIHETISLGYDDLVADTQPSGRTYIDPDGNRYPSITTVLSILNEEELAAWRKRVGDAEANKIGNRAAARGTQVHNIIEKYLLNEDITDFLPHVRQSLGNLRPILNRSIGRIFGLEAPLYSRYLGLAGRVDCVAEWEGVPSIIDFKTSRRPKKHEKIPNYFAQMAGYAVMWEERTGMPITNTVIVMDVDDHEPIIFREHRDNHIQLLIDTKKEYDRRQLFGH